MYLGTKYSCHCISGVSVDGDIKHSYFRLAINSSFQNGGLCETSHIDTQTTQLRNMNLQLIHTHVYYMFTHHIQLMMSDNIEIY